MFIAGEATCRRENHIWGNEFRRRIFLYPLLLCQIFKKKQFVKNCWRQNFFHVKKTSPPKKLRVEKSNVGNHLKRTLAKFQAKRSHPRGVNGPRKFCIFFDFSCFRFSAFLWAGSVVGRWDFEVRRILSSRMFRIFRGAGCEKLRNVIETSRKVLKNLAIVRTDGGLGYTV